MRGGWRGVWVVWGFWLCWMIFKNVVELSAQRSLDNLQLDAGDREAVFLRPLLLFGLMRALVGNLHVDGCASLSLLS